MGSRYGLEVGQKYESKNSGVYEIIEIVNSNRIVIRFVDTGYQTITISACIKHGMIKDLYSRNVYGVGFIGEGEPSMVDGKMFRTYRLWKDMLSRCYSDKVQERFPSYKGCTVCDRWHNYQLFLMDIRSLEGFDSWQTSPPRSWQFDKDIKVPGNKIYSPATCKFVTARENSLDANKRQHSK